MPFPDYTSLPQYANILHLWKLDEESGTRSDEIGSCDLADNNTVLYGTGMISNGADFEADTSEYLSATSDSSADMNFTSENFTIAFWMKPETISVNMMMFERGLWLDTNGYALLYTSTDYLKAYLYAIGDRNEVVSNAGLFSAGTWVHIVFVRNGSAACLWYIDGSDETSESDSITNPVASDENLYIGVQAGNTRYMDGLLDEIIVWDVALSSAEVSTLYNWYSKVGLSGAVSFSGSIVPKPAKTLIGAISFTGVLNVKVKKLLEGIISFIGTLQKLPKKLLSGAISFTGTLGKLPKKTLTGAITFTGTLSTKVKKTLTGAISFIGNLTSPYLDGIWSLFIKRTVSWTEKDKETTDWSAIDKEDTEWTEQD